MKAVVIIDMPTECVECPLCNDGQCDVQGKYLDDVFNQKDERCPLRPLPEEKKVNPHKMSLHEIDYAIGWNDCLDEILGETE